MKEYYWIIVLLCCALSGVVQAQPGNFCQDFEELTDTKPVDRERWKLCKRPYNSAWGTTDVRYSKTNVPDVDVRDRKWEGQVWRGERINALALLWTTRDCKDVGIEVSDLKGPGGDVIPASAIRTHFVRYVMTDELNKDKRGACGYRPDHTVFDSRLAWHFVEKSFKVFLLADVREAARRVYDGDSRNAEQYGDMEQALEGLAERARLEQARFLELYGIDYYDAGKIIRNITGEEQKQECLKNLANCYVEGTLYCYPREITKVENMGNYVIITLIMEDGATEYFKGKDNLDYFELRVIAKADLDIPTSAGDVTIYNLKEETEGFMFWIGLDKETINNKYPTIKYIEIYDK